MEFTKNAAGTTSGAATADAVSPMAGEIDLYTELITFAELSPEEQLRLQAPPKNPVSEVVEPPPDSVATLNSGSLGDVEAAEPQSEIDSGPDDSSTAGETLPISSKASGGSRGSGSLANASDTTAHAPSGSENSTESTEPTDSARQLFDRSRTGALLAGLNVPESLFAGDLSLGTCLACGAESGADDLFCVSCGVFIDDVGSTPPKSDPSCGECGQKVTTEEIFCPWCGAAPS